MLALSRLTKCTHTNSKALTSRPRKRLYVVRPRIAFGPGWDLEPEQAKPDDQTRYKQAIMHAIITKAPLAAVDQLEETMKARNSKKTLAFQDILIQYYAYKLERKRLEAAVAEYKEGGGRYSPLASSALIYFYSQTDQLNIANEMVADIRNVMNATSIDAFLAALVRKHGAYAADTFLEAWKSRRSGLPKSVKWDLAIEEATNFGSDLSTLHTITSLFPNLPNITTNIHQCIARAMYILSDHPEKHYLVPEIFVYASTHMKLIPDWNMHKELWFYYRRTGSLLDAVDTLKNMMIAGLTPSSHMISTTIVLGSIKYNGRRKLQELLEMASTCASVLTLPAERSLLAHLDTKKTLSLLGLSESQELNPELFNEMMRYICKEEDVDLATEYIRKMHCVPEYVPGYYNYVRLLHQKRLSHTAINFYLWLISQGVNSAPLCNRMNQIACETNLPGYLLLIIRLSFAMLRDWEVLRVLQDRATRNVLGTKLKTEDLQDVFNLIPKENVEPSDSMVEIVYITLLSISRRLNTKTDPLKSNIEWPSSEESYLQTLYIPESRFTRTPPRKFEAARPSPLFHHKIGFDL